MRIRHIRSATLVLDWDGTSLLVDPMLGPMGAMDPVGNATRQERIPLVELPLGGGELRRLIEGIDAVLVTHLHRDHWDATAIALLPKDKPILCQPGDDERIRAAGFQDVTPVADAQWRGIQLTRTGGQHGTGEIGKLMGNVSGFVFRAPNAPVVYLAGDTIWCDEVEQALDRHQPDIVIVNSGAAQFTSGGPITMTAADVARVCRAAPAATVVAVHLETINHCYLTRAELAAALEQEGLRERVLIPADGEVLELPVA